jgi:hypothetical protein
MSGSSSSFYHRTLVALLTLQCVTAGWVDPDTPMDARTTQPLTVVPGKIPKDAEKSDNKTKSKTPPPTASPTETPTSYPTSTPGTFHLVFSDEFNVPGRTFEDGTDPRWTALEKNDYTNNALHYYAAANAVTDNNGRLVITTEAADTPILDLMMSRERKQELPNTSDLPCCSLGTNSVLPVASLKPRWNFLENRISAAYGQPFGYWGT